MRRFWNKVNKNTDSGCWEWTACFSDVGYGTFHFRGKRWRSHRVSWILSNGEIVDNLYVLHKCDNKKCVRPDHLYLGTQKQNAQDAVNRGRHFSPARMRTHCPRGHEYDLENTQIKKDGGRVCRKCSIVHKAKARLKAHGNNFGIRSFRKPIFPEAEIIQARKNGHSWRELSIMFNVKISRARRICANINRPE